MEAQTELAERQALGPTTGELVIAPRRDRLRVGLREIWASRELLYFLTWRDLKIRYRQTAIGAGWAILQPLLLMAIFAVVLGRVGGLAPSGTPYPLFALTGLILWTLFSQSVSGAAGSLVESANLLQKVYFPRLLLPLAAIATYVLDFVIGFAMLLAILIAVGRAPGAWVIATLPVVALVLFAAAGVGVWLAAVNVRYRDVRYAIPFLVQVWLFASPVVYASGVVPEEWRPLFQLNPMVAALEAFRWAMLGTPPPDPLAIVEAVGVSAVLAALGLAYFRRVERTFADVI